MSKKLHVICGCCGDAEDLNFEILRDEYEDDKGVLNKDAVYIYCRNCGELTGLDEVIDEVER